MNLQTSHTVFLQPLQRLGGVSRNIPYYNIRHAQCASSIQHHILLTRFTTLLCALFLCGNIYACERGEGSTITSSLVSIFVAFITLAGTFVAGWFSGKVHRNNRFNATVTQQRMSHIKEMRNLFTRLFIELDKKDRTNPDEISKLICKLTFRLNPAKYPLWDGFFMKHLDKLHRIYVEGNPSEEEYTAEEAKALERRVQSLLAVEWQGMRMETWKGCSLKDKENEKLLFEQLELEQKYGK